MIRDLISLAVLAWAGATLLVVLACLGYTL